MYMKYGSSVFSFALDTYTNIMYEESRSFVADTTADLGPSLQPLTQ